MYSKVENLESRIKSLSYKDKLLNLNIYYIYIFNLNLNLYFNIKDIKFILNVILTLYNILNYIKSDLGLSLN